MRRARFGPREALGDSCAVRALREDREIPFAIRLERNPLSVAGPDRKPVVAAKRQPGDPSAPAQIVGPDNGFAAVVGIEGNALAVWGDARVFIDATRKVQWLDDA